MENSLFIAQLFGPILVVVAVALLLNFKHYLKMLDELPKNNLLLYISGILSLLIGLLLILTHNTWEGELYVYIITIFGWGALLKGIVLLIFPDWAIAQAKAWKKKAEKVKWIMWVYLLVGIYLSYMAFWA
jgi:uncharacterized membrane protein HdeD (DUF308 family)